MCDLAEVILSIFVSTCNNWLWINVALTTITGIFKASVHNHI